MKDTNMLSGNVNHYQRTHVTSSSSSSSPPTASSYDVRRIGCYDVVRTIGKGNFAVVKLARHRITGTEVAIKIVDKRSMDEANLKKIYREIQILKLLRHQHIIELYQVIETSSTIYLVLEYASQGEVYDLIFNVERLDEDSARRIFYQTLTAVEFCHKNNIVHRDLKAENLLLSGNGDVKLADFGFGNFYQPGKLLSTWCGSPPYAAPEVFEGKLYEGPHPDVWSLGVVLYVLICGTFPFDGSSIGSLKDRVVAGRFRIPYWMSADCESLIRRMLVVNTRKRITINQIKKHKWLSQIMKEKQREAEMLMIAGGRSSTPQPNDLNEQVLKIMQQQSSQFDRHQVLESVRTCAYDANYATYQLLRKRLRLELATPAHSRVATAASSPLDGGIKLQQLQNSFKRRPSNIAEHALLIKQLSPAANHENNSNILQPQQQIVQQQAPTATTLPLVYNKHPQHQYMEQQQLHMLQQIHNEVVANNQVVDEGVEMGFEPATTAALQQRTARRHASLIPHHHVTSLTHHQGDDVVSEALRRSSGFSEETFAALQHHHQQHHQTPRYDLNVAAAASADSSSSEDESAPMTVASQTRRNFRYGRRASDGLLLLGQAASAHQTSGSNHHHPHQNVLGEKLRKLQRTNGFLAITREETGTEDPASVAAISVVGADQQQSGNQMSHINHQIFTSLLAQHQQQQQNNNNQQQAATALLMTSQPHYRHVIAPSPQHQQQRRRSVHAVAPYHVPPPRSSSPRGGAATAGCCCDQNSRHQHQQNGCDVVTTSEPEQRVEQMSSASDEALLLLRAHNHKSLVHHIHHKRLLERHFVVNNNKPPTSATSSSAANNNNSKLPLTELQQLQIGCFEPLPTSVAAAAAGGDYYVTAPPHHHQHHVFLASSPFQ